MIYAPTANVVKPPNSQIVIPAASTGYPYSGYNETELQEYFLKLINQDRRQNGLSEVASDDLAAQIGQAQAYEMAKFNYLSHWNQPGYGPDIRYSNSAGTEWVQENVYSYWQRMDNGTPIPVQDWKAEIDRAQKALMNSPGHRANILNPDHTHVGIGLAYIPETGEFRVTQEFINRYVILDKMSNRMAPGSKIQIKFRLTNGATDPVINLAYEPFPQSLSLDQLRATSTYSSPAQNVNYINIGNLSGGDFQANVPLGDNPGLYHIRIWVTYSGRNPQAVDWVVWVGN